MALLPQATSFGRYEIPGESDYQRGVLRSIWNEESGGRSATGLEIDQYGCIQVHRGWISLLDEIPPSVTFNNEAVERAKLRRCVGNDQPFPAGDCVKTDDALRSTGRGVCNSRCLLIRIEDLWCGIDVRRRRRQGGRRIQPGNLREDEAKQSIQLGAGDDGLHTHPPFGCLILLLSRRYKTDYEPRHTRAGKRRELGSASGLESGLWWPLASV